MLITIYNSRLRFLIYGMVSCIVLLLCMVLSMELGYIRKSEVVSWAQTHKIIGSGKDIAKSDKPEPPPAPPLPTEIFPQMNKGPLPAINPLNLNNGDFSVYKGSKGWFSTSRESKYHTPLFIGFTRNWFLLQQAVASYVAAGWPSEQIYVVDNTGVMDSNELGLLTKQNPWYLNMTRLQSPHEKGGFGVNVIRTPTLLTFAQLQNFFINTAIEKKWDTFFWSHMDVVVISDEDAVVRREVRDQKLKDDFEAKKKELKKQGKDVEKGPEIADLEADMKAAKGEPLPPYKGFYQLVVEHMQTVKDDDMWALLFFRYDWLTLVNVQPMKEVGGWDTQIPFYMTDCDFYERLYMKNYTQRNVRAGHMYDLAGTLEDLSLLYPSPSDNRTDLNTARFKDLRHKLGDLGHQKSSNSRGRNTWQAAQNGGKGEPFWRNPHGFEFGIKKTIEFGRSMFTEKWGMSDCNLREMGRTSQNEDAWKYTNKDKSKFREWDPNERGA